jgi:prolyl oligopeptidase
MKRLLIGLLLCGILLSPCLAQKKLDYPYTRKVNVVDTIFGTKIPDPYRWLEDDTSAAVAAWVQEQNKLTFGYLDRIPFRPRLKQRLQELFNYPRYSAPYRKKGYVTFSKNDGLQNQDVVYIQRGMQGAAEILLDPNTFSEDGTARLAGLSFSQDMQYAVYGISQGGSDWRDLYVMEVATRKVFPERLQWVKFGGTSWKGNGFYYSRFDAPADTGKKLSAMNENEKVFYHRTGTGQGEDPLVYSDPGHPKRGLTVGLTDDERIEVLYLSEPGFRGNAFSIRDNMKGDTVFRPVVTSFDDQFGVIDHIDGKLLVQTNRNAPNEKLVLIDPQQPAEEHWITVLPEQKYPLSFVQTAGNTIIAGYFRDVTTRVFVYDMAGKSEREILLPGPGTAGGFGGEREDSTVFYIFSSFMYPPAIYEYNLRSGTSTLFRKAEVKFRPEEFITEQVFFPSKDSTRIPMFLVYKKGLARNGKNPALMYGYGGFNIPILPGFDVLRVALLEQGFIYASVNMRGGSEYGEKWHEGGMKLKKQNVFDDFIAGAEWLIKEGYTSKERLAMQGGSNGGLLVGAVMTQRPSLFKIALPAVGVMDMLRYQKFTIGYYWVTDYGSSDDSTQFPYIYHYSPLHNLRPGVSYPATLVTTADHDDRVVPAHSFKFIAALQEKQAGANPVLIRIQTRSGHGASSTSIRIDLVADLYAFIMANLGITPR